MLQCNKLKHLHDQHEWNYLINHNGNLLIWSTVVLINGDIVSEIKLRELFYEIGHVCKDAKLQIWKLIRSS